MTSDNREGFFEQPNPTEKISNPEKPTIAKEEKMYFNYGDEKTKSHAILVNGARINAEPLVLATWIDSRGSEMKKAEEEASTGVDLGNEEDLENIHDQLEASELEGKSVSCMAAIFREYGDQVAIANREVKDGEGTEKSGMDPYKLGNQVDFTDKNNLVFVIGEGGKDSMLSLLENPPQASVVDMRMNFRMGPPLFEQNYFSEDEQGQENGEKNIGFTVRLTYSDDAGNETETKKLFFLFAKSESEVKNGQKQVDSNQNEDGETLPAN